MVLTSKKLATVIFSGLVALNPIPNSYAGTPIPSINVNLSKATGNQNETAVAINPHDNNQLFMVSRNESGGLFTARSNDGGTTWTSKLFATHNPAAVGDLPRAYGNASAAWDEYGNLFLTFLAQGSPTTATYVVVAVSKDGGASFYSPNGVGAALTLPNTNAAVIGDQPTVTVGPGTGGFPGSVWLTYFTKGGIAVSGANVAADGTVDSFNSIVLPAQPSGVNFGDIAVGPNGEVVVTYGPDSGSLGGQIYTQVNPYGLVSFNTTSFSDPVTAIPTNVGGFSYIPAQPNWGVDPEAGLAYDRSSGPYKGRVYLVYTDAALNDPNNTDIYVRYSNNFGYDTWSEPVRVNDDTGSNSQFLPHISLDQNTGQLAVTWYDARSSLNNNTTEYYGAFSSDGGATFQSNFKISAGVSDQANSVAVMKKSDYGDYSGNAFVNGRLVSAWADNSNSTGDNPEGATNFDVYTAIVQTPVVAKSSVSVAFPAPSASGWYNSPSVEGVINANSPDSTIASITCNGGVVSNLVGLGASSATATVSVANQGVNDISCTVVDATGNSAISSNYSINIDSVAPTLAPTLSLNAPILLNAVVSALPNAADSGSGINTASCGNVDTTTAGTQTVSCTASDNAGNDMVTTINYVVGYGVANIQLSPKRAVKAKATLDVKFQLIDAAGNVIPDSLVSKLGTCGVSAALNGAQPICAEYLPAQNLYEITVKLPASFASGFYPLALTAVQNGVTLAAADLGIVVK